MRLCKKALSGITNSAQRFELKINDVRLAELQNQP